MTPRNIRTQTSTDMPPSVDSSLDDSALEAELLRNVLDTVTHDLGGLSSALALRADVMQRSAPGAAANACSAIANELRSLGGQLRELSGKRGAGALAPTPSGSLERWFALVTRFGQPLLGRGVALRGEIEDRNVGATATYELAFITLAMLHAVRERQELTHHEVRVSSVVHAPVVAIRMGLHTETAFVPMTGIEESAWYDWARSRAARAGINMHLVDGHVELTVPIHSAAQAG